jgi:hypothetical protein
MLPGSEIVQDLIEDLMKHVRVAYDGEEAAISRTGTSGLGARFPVLEI